MIRPGVNIGVSGSSFNKKKLLALFNDLHGLSKLMAETESKIVERVNGDCEERSGEEGLGYEERTFLAANYHGDQNVYDDATAYILALVTVADGVVEEAEIEFAHEFIREEESVRDKEEAIKKYDASIFSLSEAKSKSMALFKIRANKLFSSVVEIKDAEFFNRISIMLEGMVEAAGGFNNQETVEMVNMVLSGRLFSSSVSGGIKAEVEVEDVNDSEIVEDPPRDLGGEIYDLGINIQEGGGFEGVSKYWPRVERFVVGKLLDVADEKLNQPEELSVYFSKLHDLLPVAVRLVISKDRFVDILMSKRVVILDKVRLYRVEREAELLPTNWVEGVKVDGSNAKQIAILAEAIKNFEINIVDEDEDPDESLFFIFPIKAVYSVVMDAMSKGRLWKNADIEDEDIVPLSVFLIGSLYSNALVGLPKDFKTGMGDTWFVFLGFPLAVMDLVSEVCADRGVCFDVNEDDAMMMQLLTSDFSDDPRSKAYMDEFLANAGVSKPFDLAIKLFGEAGVSRATMCDLKGSVNSEVRAWFQEMLKKAMRS